MSDLVLNVKQISNYPQKTNATGLENLLLQAGLGAPYQSITSGALVATALENAGSMGIGYGLPNTPPPTSGQLFASNFIAPINGGFQFNTYLDSQGTLRYWNTGAAADWAYDQNAGFIWRRFPDGQAGTPITFPAPLMALSQSGHLTLYFDTITVVRDPSAPFEVATLNWVNNNTVQSFNNRQGPIKLNAQDVYQALQLTSAIATQDYTNSTINSSIQQLLMTCPFVNSWNGRSGSVYLTLSDITCVFFQSGQQPIAPTPPATSDDNSIATTQWVTQHVGLSTGSGAIIANTPPANPFPGELWFDSVGVQLYVWYDDGTSQQWVIANNSGGGSSGGGSSGGGGANSNLLISASPPLSPTPGTQWWNTIDGNSYIYYDDGTSQQWVPATSTAGVVGGPFLPTSGGTVNGNVSIGANQPNYITISGGAAGSPAQITTSGDNAGILINPALDGRLNYRLWRGYPAPDGQPESVRWDYAVTGNVASGVNAAVETHAVNNDNSTGGMAWFNFAGGIQSGATGGRTGLGMSFNQGGNTTCASGQYYVAGAFWANAYGNAGGTAGAHAGTLFGVNDSVWLKAGATYWEAISGYELDVGAEAGTQVNFKQGISVTLWNTDAVAGSQGRDYAYAIGAMGTTSPGWDIGYSMQTCYGYWGIKPTGTLIGTGSGTAGGPAYQAAWGIDFNTVTFSGGLLRGPGFSVNGNGGVTFTGTASGSGDLTRHINLSGGNTGFCVASGTLVYNVAAGNVHNFLVGGSFAGQISASGIMTYGILTVGAGATWNSGNGAPSATRPAGSLYSRIDGATGTRLYVSAGGGTWNPVAGV